MHCFSQSYAGQPYRNGVRWEVLSVDKPFSKTQSVFGKQQVVIIYVAIRVAEGKWQVMEGTARGLDIPVR